MFNDSGSCLLTEGSCLMTTGAMFYSTNVQRENTCSFLVYFLGHKTLTEGIYSSRIELALRESFCPG